MAEQATEIRLLPLQVANQIAAGEVVERPASVVKELMENAIDAGGDRIDVQVVAGGRKLIAVTDNGKGMTRDDAILSIERHATSKILTAADIDAIATLGFRGEALAAIASVSRFRVTTCRHDETVGTALVVNGGVIQDVHEIGVPAGTQVEVRDLFFNTPARRKFLRTEQTELNHIRETFLIQALAHPGLSMSLKVDDHALYTLAATQDFRDRLRDLFSPELIEHLVRLDLERAGVKATGYISQPMFNRADRHEQYLFINGRSTSPALLSYAISEGCRGRLPKGRFPSLFLFLTMDPGAVDVNVHPTKKEVRFRKPMEIRDLVIEAIDLALNGDPVVEDSLSETQGVPTAVGLPALEQSLPIRDLPAPPTIEYPRRKVVPPSSPANQAQAPTERLFNSPLDPSSVGAADQGAASESVEMPDNSDPDDRNTPWVQCRVLGQVGGYYIALETEQGLVMMDPRAAHERVLFDRLMQTVLSEKPLSQGLLLPETIALSSRDAARVRKNLDALTRMGFGISDFGGDHFIVDAVPVALAVVSASALIRDMASSLEQGGLRSRGAMIEEELAKTACLTAVRARQALSLDEIEKLVVDLASCDMPYTSPRGRPTLMLISLKELHSKFGRESVPND